MQSTIQARFGPAAARCNCQKSTRAWALYADFWIDWSHVMHVHSCVAHVLPWPSSTPGPTQLFETWFAPRPSVRAPAGAHV